MKTTRIDIEGEIGHATLQRDGRMIVIEGRTMPADKSFRLLADAHNPTNWTVAKELQRKLQGYAGTNGDIEEYYRLIQQLAD